MASGQDVPGYLGLVLSEGGVIAGTCFQVASGLLVTAWHVVNGLGAGHLGGEVQVEELLPGRGAQRARVVAVGELADLAVLEVTAPLAASIRGLGHSGLVPEGSQVRILGAGRLEGDTPHRYLPAAGTWRGPAMRRASARRAFIQSPSILPGMSGAPVRRPEDDWVVGIVVSRYQSPDDDGFGSGAWLALVEDLLPLLPASAVVAVDDGLIEFREYLAAAVRAARDHPYPGVAQDLVPPLAAVHLNQLTTLSGPPAGSGPGAEAVIARRVSAEDLKAMDEDCVVIAGPGMGKTSLLRLTLIEAAREWDGEAGTLLPVRMLATDLLENEPMAVLMQRAAEKDLDRVEAARGVFGRTLPPGARWLLLVDGIDEILDAATRQIVWRRLAARASPEDRANYRVIVATRPLAEAEMAAVFSAAGWSPLGFGLQPFSKEDIGELAQKWFTALGMPDPEQEASRFAAELARADRTTLAGTPLMATMLCQIHAADPSRPLPRSRGAIYQAFVGLLQDNFDRPHARERMRPHPGQRTNENYVDIVVQARSALGPPDGEAARHAEQAVQRLPQLVAHLAAERRAGNSGLALDVVAAGPLARNPPDVQPGRWRDYLHALLLRCGMLDIRGGDFVFLHRTLMDYLVARYHSDRPRAIREALKVSGTRKFLRWHEPREDPSFISFILDPGPASGITERKIQALLLRVVRHGGLKGMGFIGEQIRLGTAIPERVTTDMRTRLESTARTDKTESITAACILADVDFGRGIGLLVSLALDIDLYGRAYRRAYYLGENLALDAVREVVALDRSRGTALLCALASGPGDGEAADSRQEQRQLEAAVMLAELERDIGVELLESMAASSDLGVASRVKASAALAKLGAQPSTEFLTETADDRAKDPEDRVAAARVLVQMNHPSGAGLLETAVLAAIGEALWYRESFQGQREALAEIGIDLGKDKVLRKVINLDSHRDNLREQAEESIQVMMDLDREAATSMLEQVAALPDVSGTDHDWIATILDKSREGKGSAAGQDADLAGIDPQWLSHQLGDISISMILGARGRRRYVTGTEPSEQDGNVTLPAGLIPSLQHPAAAGLLSAVARDDTYSGRDRFSAIYQLAAFHDPAAEDLLDSFIRDSGNHLYYRRQAIAILGGLDPGRALAAMETFADDPFSLYIETMAVAAEWDLPGTRGRLEAMLGEIPLWHIRKQIIIRGEKLVLRFKYRHRKY